MDKQLNDNFVSGKEIYLQSIPTTVKFTPNPTTNQGVVRAPNSTGYIKLKEKHKN